MIEGKKILVTGSCGFLANNLIARTLKKNWIYGVDIAQSSHSHSNYTHILFNPQKIDMLNRIPEDIDYIFHFAAIMDKKLDWRDYKRINVDFTANMLKFGKSHNIEKFIFASTGGVYGYKTGPSKETDDANPEDLYSMSKLKAEERVREYSDYFQTVIHRYFFPYGAGLSKKRLIARLIENIKNDLPVALNKNGSPIINPIYISDLIDIVLMSSYKNKPQLKIYNVAGNDAVSIETLCKTIIAPKLKKLVIVEQTEKTVQNLIGSIDILHEEYDWKPKIGIEDGISKMIRGEKKWS